MWDEIVGLHTDTPQECLNFAVRRSMAEGFASL